MSLPSNSKRKIFDGRYEILSLVGRGADSVVYHGRHITGAAQEVAIKVLVNRSGTTTLTDKLRREALTLVSCRHRYVVRLDDFHSIQELCYLSMEYAALGDLSKFIGTLPSKRLNAEQVALFLKQCLEAIDFVHATGVIHRDLKPENILVLNDKEIRVADFGLALLPGDEVQLDELRKAVGSFDYLAPEVLDGVRYDTLSDLYSLGVCFYEAATGVHPFAHVPIAERHDARRDSRVTPLYERAPELPAHVAGVISTLMRFSDQDRFQSASDALRALEDAGYRASSSTPTETTPEINPLVAPSPSNNDQIQPEQPPAQAPSQAFSAAAPSSSVSPASQAVAQPAPIQAPPPNSPAQPTNTDVASSRQPNPTEKIDLERIKAIIAKDSQRRSGTTSGAGSPATGASTTELSPGNALAKGVDTSPAAVPLAPSPVDRRGKQKVIQPAGVGGPRAPLFTTALIRFAGVALAFALLTVGGIYGYNLVFKKSASDKRRDPSTAVVSQPLDGEPPASETEAEADTKTQTAIALSQLPDGMYTGSIQGLFPGSDLPMALLANQKQHTLTLLLGLEGWIPATIPTGTEGNTDSEGPTFRSNGLILKFNQESSSAVITGTVLDVVTGEAGTWKLTK
jgi:serine/threonine protein kinase